MKVSSFQPMQGFDGAVRAATRKPAQPAAQNSSRETGNSPAVIISPDELQYFTSLYPEQSNEISSYSTYSKNGVSREYSVGSLIDKKS